MYLQSIKSVKQKAAKSVTQVNLKKSRHKGFGVFIVHSFMRISVHWTTERLLKVLSNGAGGGPKLVSIDPF